MTILYLIPPRLEGRWVIREHKEGAFDFPHLPLLAASVLGLVRRNHPDADIRVLDAQLEGLDLAGVKARVSSLKPDLVIAQLGSYTMKHDKPCAELGYPTICITPESFDPLEVIRLYDVRATCFTVSEIEKTISGAVGEFRETGRITNTPGLVVRDGEEIRCTAARPFTPLSDLPAPAYDLFDPELYFRVQEKETGSRCAFIYTSRGCPFSCRFCTSDAEKPVRFKAIDQVIGEMAYFRVNHGCTSFNFCDSTFSADRRRTIDLLKKIQETFPGISYIVNDSVNTVDEEMLDAYAASGCSLIRFGIESGDRDILKRMTKTLSPSKALAVFRGARDRGIATDAFVMVGFPGETEESLERTRHLISNLEPDRFTVSVLFPKPFSTLWLSLKDSGDLMEEDWDRYPAPVKPMFRHDTYASLKEIMQAKERLTGKITRDLARKKFARSSKGLQNLLELAVGHIKTVQVLKRPVLALCKRSALLRRVIYRLADYDRMYTRAQNSPPASRGLRARTGGQGDQDLASGKTVLFLMPPRPDETAFPWYLREERHSGGETSFFLAPAMAAGVIARVRQDLPDARIVFRDLQLDPLGRNDLDAFAGSLNPDMVVALASANLISTESERMVLELPFPTLCILSPVQADPEEAARRYGLACRYFSHTDEVERTVAAALGEFFETGGIRTTAGMYVRDGDRGFFTEPAEPGDMADLPMPAYDVIGLDRYLDMQSAAEFPRSALMNTMKGCPFSCTFCCVGSDRYPARSRDARAMFDEVRVLHERFGVEEINFLNSEFSPDRKTAKAFCRRVIESGMRIRYTIKERIECVDAELLDLLKKSGCTTVYYGVETSDPRVQERIRKKIDLNRAVDVIGQTRAAGIKAVIYMMLGLPGEDGMSLKANMDFVLRARPDGTVWSTLFPEHGSPLLEELKAGSGAGTPDWSDYRSPALLGYPHEFYTSRAHVEKAKLRLQLSYRLALAVRGGAPAKERARSLAMAALTFAYLVAVFPLESRSRRFARIVEKAKISVSRRIGPIL